MSEAVCVEGSLNAIKQAAEEEQYARALKKEYLTRKLGSKYAAEDYLRRNPKKHALHPTA